MKLFALPDWDELRFWSVTAAGAPPSTLQPHLKVDSRRNLPSRWFSPSDLPDSAITLALRASPSIPFSTAFYSMPFSGAQDALLSPFRPALNRGETPPRRAPELGFWRRACRLATTTPGYHQGIFDLPMIITIRGLSMVTRISLPVPGRRKLAFVPVPMGLRQVI